MASDNGREKEKRGDWVTVRTTLPTLPLPAASARAPLETARLVLRPLAETDLEALHALRTQPEVMVYTLQGRVDADRAATGAWLARFLTPPDDREVLNCAICLKAPDDGTNGRVVGVGGVHVMTGDSGWPELGYMINRDCWGRGYATEFLHGFLALYATLPRPTEPMLLRVLRHSLSETDAAAAAAAEAAGAASDASPPVVEEMLTAVVADRNGASQRVLQKCGLEAFMSFVEHDANADGDADADDASQPNDILLHRFRYAVNRTPPCGS